MFKPHILTKLIERSNVHQIRHLLLVGGEVSKNLSEILNNSYLFPKIKVENNGYELKYQVLDEKVRLREYNELVERELATEAYKIKINQEDILELGVVQETEVSGLFTNVNKNAKYFKVTLKKEIVLFLTLLIEHLRAEGEFRMRTVYVGSENYFEFLKWYRIERIEKENFWIYWGGGGGVGGMEGGGW